MRIENRKVRSGQAMESGKCSTFGERIRPRSGRRRKRRRSANNTEELTLFPVTVGSGGEEGRKWYSRLHDDPPTPSSPSSSTTGPAQSVSYIKILLNQPGFMGLVHGPDFTTLLEIPLDQLWVGLQFFVMTQARALAVAGGVDFGAGSGCLARRTSHVLS